DYLVGRDVEKTRDLQALQDVTGLSHEAINTLIRWHKADERGRSYYNDNGNFLAGSHISDLNTVLEEYPDILYNIARGISGSDYNENGPCSCTSDDHCIDVAIKLLKYKDSKKKVIPSDKDRINFATAYISKKMKSLVEQHEYDRAQLDISKANTHTDEDAANVPCSLEEAVSRLDQEQKRFLIGQELWSDSFGGRSLNEYERLYENVSKKLSKLYGKKNKTTKETEDMSKLEDICNSLGEGIANGFSKSLMNEAGITKKK
ncbi:MAG: hypothetical protein LUG61_04090, partial [Lachnospiraceae bacterium]|nr:hypothetical protein [Lachnospiraceae bacterium]